jgi:hypothetical protein
MLKGMMLERFIISQSQYLTQRPKPFVLQNGILYKFGQDNKFRFVLQPKQVLTILQELHSGVGGGHFFSDITMRKILNADYWWPTMNRDVHEFC